MPGDRSSWRCLGCGHAAAEHVVRLAAERGPDGRVRRTVTVGRCEAMSPGKVESSGTLQMETDFKRCRCMSFRAPSEKEGGDGGVP